jgi:hypothetical protein
MLTLLPDGWWRLEAWHRGVKITAEYRSQTEATLHLLRLEP